MLVAAAVIVVAVVWRMPAARAAVLRFAQPMREPSAGKMADRPRVCDHQRAGQRGPRRWLMPTGR
jgi:hypothetical protein